MEAVLINFDAIIFKGWPLIGNSLMLQQSKFLSQSSIAYLLANDTALARPWLTFNLISSHFKLAGKEATPFRSHVNFCYLNFFVIIFSSYAQLSHYGTENFFSYGSTKDLA